MQNRFNIIWFQNSLANQNDQDLKPAYGVNNKLEDKIATKKRLGFQVSFLILCFG